MCLFMIICYKTMCVLSQDTHNSPKVVLCPLHGGNFIIKKRYTIFMANLQVHVNEHTKERQLSTYLSPPKLASIHLVEYPT